MTLLAGPHLLWWVLVGLFGLTGLATGSRMGLRLLLIAALGSGIWLLLAPLLPRWRTHVAETLSREAVTREHQERETRRKALRADLSAAMTKQSRAFGERIGALRELLVLQGAQARDLMMSELERLEALEDAHLQLLSLMHRQRLHLGQNDTQRIRREIDQVCRDLASPASNAHREALEENLAILEKRQARLRELEDEVQVLAARIQVLEDALDLAYEQILAMKADPSRDTDLEALFSGLTVAERTLAEMRALEMALEDGPSGAQPTQRQQEQDRS
ncbi:MAG: hypothetical protein VKO64_11640 [Candidatus Sericytochromatia bacterium]|nr:hypothetical protein [Candidatus Sericytochromatia bacterium]